MCRTTAALIICLLQLTACKDSSQPSQPAETTTDAASQPSAAATYKRIADSIDSATPEQLGAADISAIRPWLAARANDIEALIEASKAVDAGFNVDYTKDLQTLIPHLGHVRPCARLLASDAKRCIADGDGDGASKRLAAIVRMANQVSANGHALIEYLVAAALVDLAAKETVSGAQTLKSSPWKTELQVQLATISPMNPLRLKEVLASERDMIARSLRANTIPTEFSPEIAGLSTSEREQAAKDVETCFGDIIRAWDASDRNAALNAAMKSPAANGPAKSLVLSGDRIFTAADRLNASVAQAKQAIAR